MSTQSLDSDIYDYGFILNSTALHEAAMSVLVTTIYGRWRTITIGQAKDATVSFAQAKDAKGNLQPTIYVYEKDSLMHKLCMTRTINLSNTQFRYQ